MMDNTPSREEDLKSPKQPKIVDKQAPKRRKVVHKHVVRVRIEANVGKQKSDGPPPDSWSWRKYGQKPIKGSPFPRKGYYRCSTSKGCSAKKQVERCKTDAAVLIITYTSKHSHPGPDLPFISPTKTLVQTKSDQHDPSTISCGPDLSSATASLQCSQDNEDISQQNAMKQVAPDDDQGNLSIQFDEGGPLPAPHMMSLPPTPPKSSQENENDFFDELEELPISSSLTSLVRSCFFDERILLPS